MDEYEAEEDFTPLVMPQNELMKAQTEIRLNSEEKHVVSGAFDACRIVAVAPYHLLAGIAKTVI